MRTAKDETVDELKARFDKARAEDRPELGIQIAEQQLHNADKLYNDGKVDEARAAVDDIVTYSEKARDAATQTKKHLKKSKSTRERWRKSYATSNALSPSKTSLRSNRPSTASKTSAPPCSMKCSPRTTRREKK